MFITIINMSTVLLFQYIRYVLLSIFHTVICLIQTQPPRFVTRPPLPQNTVLPGILKTVLPLNNKSQIILTQQQHVNLLLFTSNMCELPCGDAGRCFGLFSLVWSLIIIRWFLLSIFLYETASINDSILSQIQIFTLAIFIYLKYISFANLIALYILFHLCRSIAKITVFVDYCKKSYENANIYTPVNICDTPLTLEYWLSIVTTHQYLNISNANSK